MFTQLSLILSTFSAISPHDLLGHVPLSFRYSNQNADKEKLIIW